MKTLLLIRSKAATILAGLTFLLPFDIHAQLTPIDITAQPVYGVGWDIPSNAQSIFVVDYYTGKTSAPKKISCGLFLPNFFPFVFGVARNPTQVNGQQARGVLSTQEAGGTACGLGTTFFDVNLETGAATPLGTATDFTYIRDIEYSPSNKKLYGIYYDKLVRIDDLGTDCLKPQYTPAKVVIIGSLVNVGVGPYSVSFNQTGECYILSANDHNKALVVIPPVDGSQVAPLPLAIKPGSHYHNPVPDIGTSLVNIEIASCISGGRLMIGLANDPNGTGPFKAFYHFGTPWGLKGAYCLRDYTANPVPAGPR